MRGKYAFVRELPGVETLAAAETALAASGLKEMGIEALRLYSEFVDGRLYGFQFYALADGADGEAVLTHIRRETGALDGWREARHVYEFKLHPGDRYEGLRSQGIIIGVREGMLEEYIRLHDEQPQIIHDLCYQNGFRKSSIFVADLQRPYLLQFQEFSGEENPDLYEDDTYRLWLRVTGECQKPLPGEKFWKPMPLRWEI